MVVPEVPLPVPVPLGPFSELFSSPSPVLLLPSPVLFSPSPVLLPPVPPPPKHC